MNGDDRPTGATLGVKIFLALVIIGFGAAGYGGLKTYLDNRAVKSAVEDHGIKEDASVSSVTEVSGRRIETYHRINVNFDPSGPEVFASAEVLDCSGHRYDGEDTMEVVYLPEDPDVVRLADCLASFDTNILPGIVGLIFGGLALFMIWRVRHVWTS